MKSVERLKTINLFYLFKTGVGSALAILIAESLGLLYSPSAGIITLLTIQNTKKETLFIAVKRILAFLIATATSFLVFHNQGYTPLAFGVFVFLFVALCSLLGLRDGISMNAVLMTHFLIEKRMDFSLLLNESALLIIGMGIGIILNMIMPRDKERIRKRQHNLEEEFKIILHKLSNKMTQKTSCLLQGEQVLGEQNTVNIKQMDLIEPELTDDFERLEKQLEDLLKKAYEESENTLLSNTKYLVSYLQMRRLQLSVLKNIGSSIEKIPVLLRQTFPMAEFIEHIAASFHEKNNVVDLLRELDGLNELYRQDKLPITREEFEYRAVLYQILKDLEYFLILKRNFVIELNEKNMKSYWA